MSVRIDVQKPKLLRSQPSALVGRIASRRTQSLNGIYETHRFETVGEFVSAVQATNGTAGGAPAAKSGKQRLPSKITPEMKDKLKATVIAGRTGKEIAKEPGISLPSVRNIKMELGLVKARK